MMLWRLQTMLHALLFLGQTDAAVEAYTEHKGQTTYIGKWEKVILKDFAEFRSRGLAYPDMARVEKALAEAPKSAHADDPLISPGKDLPKFWLGFNVQEVSVATLDAKFR